MANLYSASYSDVEKVIHAIKNGDLASLTNLIENGAPVNYESFFNEAEYNPLYQAVENNQYECAKLLIEHGANVNFQSFTNYTPLHAAVTTENLQLVTLLLENGGATNINSLTNALEGNNSPLSLAAQNGAVDIAKTLVEFGTDVNLLSGVVNLKTPLTYATEAKHPEMVKFLTENDAKINTLPPFQNDLSGSDVEKVVNAAQNGDVALLKNLIESGAPVNYGSLYNEAQYNPLYQAVENNQYECAKLLIEHGADVNFKSFTEYTPLHAAVTTENLKLVTLLLENGGSNNINALTNDFFGKDSPLSLAASNGSVDIAKTLIEFGADVNLLGGFFEKSTPLTYAAAAGHLEMVNFLIENGANVNTFSHVVYDDEYNLDWISNLPKDSDKNPLPEPETLYLQLTNGVIKYLTLDADETTIIEGNINPDDHDLGNFHIPETLNGLVNIDSSGLDDATFQQDILKITSNRGHTPALGPLISAYCSSALFNALGHALGTKNPEIVKVLLDAGANDLGWTPLHLAIITQDLHLAEEAIHQNTAFTNTPDSLGLYPIQYGARGDSTDILDLLVNNGANTNISYPEADFPFDSPRLDSILHISVINNNPEVTKWCVNHVENIDHTSSGEDGGATALTLACKYGHTEQVQILLEHGADVNHQNENDLHQTPLSEAIHSHEDLAQTEIVRALITFGADVNLQDKNGDTPLHHAVNHLETKKPGAVELIDLLIENGADPSITTNDGKTAIELAHSESNHYSDYPTEILSILNSAEISHTDSHTADLGIDNTHIDTTTTPLTTSDVFDNSNSNPDLNTLANLKDNAPSTDAAANIDSLGALDSTGFVDPLNAHFDTHYVATTTIDNLLHGDDIVASEY